VLNNRVFNILTIILILVWIWADRYLQIGAPAYGWLLLIYVAVLFCGSYFIRFGFFMKSICSVKTNERWIALSFDDGPTPVNTARILDILRENNVEATFFCIGKNIEGNEGLIRRMDLEGHIIGNHSYTHHLFFDLFNSGKMLHDLQEMSRITKTIIGKSPVFFRPPYGVTNPPLKKAVLNGGFISIGWSIRSYDTVARNGDRLVNKVVSSLKPGTILLLHDTSEVTLEALPRLLKNIQDKGYQIKRLDKMINLNPYD
jgi:peptidoglycan/xylan/chitin deacetylase (PgdA/CDA1 family)